MKKILLLVAVCMIDAATFAQTLTDNGSIHYKMTMNSTDPQAQQAQQMFNNAAIEIGFMNGRMRVETTMPMAHIRGYSVGDSMLMLMDMMGQKYKMKVPKDYSSKRLDEKSYEVTETKETKKIAGYNTTKYIVKTKDGQTFNVYATNDLPVQLAKYSPYSKVKGVPLEYEMAQGPYKIDVMADAVKTGGEKEEMYKYDETGYTVMSADQMKGMTGGGQHGNH